MENELIIGKKNVVSLVTETSHEELLKPLSHEILLFESFIAGTTHIGDETVFEEMKAGDKLNLFREPENRYDENAIRIEDEKKRKMGYIPEKDNLVFSRLMDAGKYLTARIDRIERKGSFRSIAISIYLVDF